jgi:hypothetical protein
MSIGEIWRRLRFLFQGDRLEQDLDDELGLHRELLAAKLRQHGLPEEEAEYAARRKLGNETRAVEMPGARGRLPGSMPSSKICVTRRES